MRIVVSRLTAEYLEAELGSLPPDVIVIPDPVDVEVYPETPERMRQAAQ